MPKLNLLQSKLSPNTYTAHIPSHFASLTPFQNTTSLTQPQPRPRPTQRHPSRHTCTYQDFKIVRHCISTGDMVVFIWKSISAVHNNFSTANIDSCNTYEGWSKSSFLFLIHRKVQILSKFCDVHIEIKYISSNWMLFEKQLWRHSLWHVTSHDLLKDVIVVNRFSRVASAKFEIFIRSKKHSIPLRNAHLKLIATDPNTI